MTDPDNAQRIEKLKTVPPVVAGQSRKQRILSAARNVCALIAIVAFGLGLYSTHQSSAVGACVNQNLSTRNTPAAADAQAHIDFAVAVAAVFREPLSEAQQRAAVAALKREAQRYAQTLRADQAARNAHPLGRC